MTPTTTGTAVRTTTLKSWIIVLGLVPAAFALALGMWNAANLVGTDLGAFVSIVHRTGTVAGASTDASDVPVRLTVKDSTGQRTYLVATGETLSIFNVLRAAQSTTLFQFTAVAKSDGMSQITSADGVKATGRKAWVLSVNGSPATSLDTTLIRPGDELLLFLKGS